MISTDEMASIRCISFYVYARERIYIYKMTGIGGVNGE